MQAGRLQPLGQHHGRDGGGAGVEPLLLGHLPARGDHEGQAGGADDLAVAGDRGPRLPLVDHPRHPDRVAGHPAAAAELGDGSPAAGGVRRDVHPDPGPAVALQPQGAGSDRRPARRHRGASPAATRPRICRTASRRPRHGAGSGRRAARFGGEHDGPYVGGQQVLRQPLAAVDADAGARRERRHRDRPHVLALQRGDDRLLGTVAARRDDDVAEVVGAADQVGREGVRRVTAGLDPCRPVADRARRPTGADPLGEVPVQPAGDQHRAVDRRPLASRAAQVPDRRSAVDGARLQACWSRSVPGRCRCTASRPAGRR